MKGATECKKGQSCWSENLVNFVAQPCRSAIEQSLNSSPYYAYKWGESSEDILDFKVFTITGGNRFLFMGDSIQIKSTSADFYSNGKERENGRFMYIGDKAGVGEFFQHSYACGVTINNKPSGGDVNLSFDASKVDVMINFGAVE
jgi:hypothetical protein